MDTATKETLWKQFGASIDMLENAISLCTDELWDNEKKFWYNAYHCLFYLDYYFTHFQSLTLRVLCQIKFTAKKNYFLISGTAEKSATI